MTREVFDQLVLEIRSGTNTGLAEVSRFQDDCVRMLRLKSAGKCSDDQAYDIFIDAVLDFRRNVLQNRVTFQNIKAYLKRICWFKWLEMNRKKGRMHKAVHDVRRSLYPDPTEEQESAVVEAPDSRLALVAQGMQALSDKCRRILQLVIIDEVSMTEVANLLGFASANVAKTSKSRCYQKLISEIRKLQSHEGQD